MKDFKNKGFRIANSPTEVKLVYTGFLIFTFVGYLTIVLIGLLRVGPSYGDIATHYRGSETDEVFARSVGQMLEEAHFHAFIEGLMLLVLAHLFVATSASQRVKYTVIILAFVSTFLDLAAPWLIKFVSPVFALLQMTCWLIMVATALAFIGVPLYDMWYHTQPRRSR